VILTEPISHNDYSIKYFFIKGFGGIYGTMAEHKVKQHSIESYARERNENGKFKKKSDI
jgi:hypothetical protein